MSRLLAGTYSRANGTRYVDVRYLSKSIESRELIACAVSSRQSMNRSCWFLLLLALPSQAQQGGFISGSVRDRSSGTVPGAEVRVQSEQTGARQKIFTDSAGLYSTSELSPGLYQVTVRNDGFRTTNRGEIQVGAAQHVRLDFTLDLLPVQQEVTVIASENENDPLVSGVTVSRETPAASLPSNGHDVHALFELMPGATVTPASLTSGGQFTVGGQRPNENSFRVDGVSGNVGIGIISVPGSFPGGSLPGMTTIGGMQSLASNEETERVELLSADFAAQYGDRPGAQIDIETRAGTNELHGSAFGYLRPQSFNSTDWFARGAAQDLAPDAAERLGWKRRWSHLAQSYVLLLIRLSGLMYMTARCSLFPWPQWPLAQPLERRIRRCSIHFRGPKAEH